MAGIFLIQESGQLVEMTEQQYGSEDDLQRLLADYPKLLTGNQANGVTPRRWLLVSREIQVPSEGGAIGRLAVDHLFVDEDGVPTLVEVKRSSNPEIRRQVVGQMLDYAANAVISWPADLLRVAFEGRCEKQRLVPDEVMADCLGDGIDPNQFWQSVGANLRAGRLRLVFVADEIPPQLRRIVEFLNEQMNPAEVLALEVKQFVGQNVRTLVPQVIGQTSKAQHQKATTTSSPAREWDEDSFFAELASKGTDVVNVARQILDWAQREGLRVSYGRSGSALDRTNKNGRLGGLLLQYTHAGSEYHVCSLFTDGRLQLHPPPSSLSDERDRMESLLEFSLATSKIPGAHRQGGIPLAGLNEDSAIAELHMGINWITQQIRSTEATSAS